MHKLSICFNVKNRSLIRLTMEDLCLFPACINSLVKCLPTIPCETEVVIADWESTDWPIKYWIQGYLPETDVHLVTVQGKYFNHGLGRNIAAEHASGDALFFLDADLIVVPEVFSTGLEAYNKGHPFYPIYGYQLRHYDTKLDWSKRPGALLISRETFYKAGKWPEYKRWGFEDFAFMEQLQQFYNVECKKIKGFRHQWHPQDADWKNRYCDPGPAAIKEADDLRFAWKEKVDEEEQDLIQGLNVLTKQAIEKPRGKDIIGNDVPVIGDRHGSKH